MPNEDQPRQENRRYSTYEEFCARFYRSENATDAKARQEERDNPAMFGKRIAAGYDTTRRAGAPE